jgi:hypothetical protein
MHVLAQALGCSHSAPWDVTLPEDVVRWEANHAYSERLQVWRQKRWAFCTAWAVARARGQDTPSEPKSSGGDNEEEDEEGEEGEVTPPPHSPPRETLPSLGDVFGRQAWIIVGTRQLRQPQTGTRSSTISPP